MASVGYSGTPLPQKLGLKPGARFVLDRAPPEWAGAWPETYGALPDGVTVATRLPRARSADVVLSFHTEAKVLDVRLAALAGAILPDGSMWIAWPKRAAKVPTDVTENVVRDLALAAGLVDVKVCAIDEIWSGLKLVYRTKDRAALRGA
jgi:hypothetical protein